MNGHVFLTPAESKDPKLFERTLEELKRYVDTTFQTGASDLSSIFSEEIKSPVLLKPEKLPEKYKDDVVELKLWEMTVKSYGKRKEALERNLYSLYAIVWGQCSSALQAKLTSISSFESIKESSNVVLLLREIRKISWSMDTSTNPTQAYSIAMKRLISLRQRPETPLSEHYKDFKTLLDIVEHFAGNPFHVPDKLRDHERVILLAEDEDIEALQTESWIDNEVERRARNRLLGMNFLFSGDAKIFGSLWSDYATRQGRGFNEYPVDLTAAYKVMNEHERKERRKVRATMRPTTPQNANEGTQDGAVFLIAGTDGRTFDTITCRKCKKKGHYSNQCPGTSVAHPDGTNDADITMLQLYDASDDEHEALNFSFLSHTFHQRNHALIDPNWILLDTCSTISIFCNQKLVTNVRPCDGQGIVTHSNGGKMQTKFIADVRNFDWVWFNPKSLANILSFAHVRSKYRITCDTEIDASMTVHASNGPIVFKEFQKGLYYYDTSSTSNPHNDKSSLAYSFFLDATVEEREQQFTKRQLDDARTAIRFYHRIGHPGLQQYVKLLNMSYFRNCPITSADASRAQYIYGPDIFALKAKTVRAPTAHIPTQIPYVPEALLSLHRNVHLCVDIVQIEGLYFLITISRNICFRTIHDLTRPDKVNLLKALQDAINIYSKGGYTVVCISGDNAFSCLENEPGMPDLHICAANEHVPEAERSIRTLRERVRARYQQLRFTRLPKAVIRSLAKQGIINLNSLPALHGVSSSLSPFTIVTGHPAPDFSTLRVDFGAYCQVHDEPDPSNTNQSRTTGAIALHASSNIHHSYYFLSLTTGKVLHRRAWTVLPMSNDVIKRLETLAEAEGQPMIRNSCPAFEYSPGYAVPDDDDDIILPSTDTSDTVPPVADISQHDVPHDEAFADVRADDADASVGADSADAQSEIDDAAPVENTDAYEDPTPDIEERNTEEHHIVDDEDRNLAMSTTPDFPHTSAPAEPPYDIEERVSVSDTAADKRVSFSDDAADFFTPNASRMQLRPRKPRTYNRYPSADYIDVPTPIPQDDVNLLNLSSVPRDEVILLNLSSMMKTTTGIILTVIGANAVTGALTHKDMPAHQAIKRFGKAAVAAVIEEYRQLHDKKVVQPKKFKDLTREEKIQALRAITLVKQKRCGRMKARTVADGRKQKLWVPKEHSSSSAASNEATALTLIVDAHENRDVATLDVPGAYLHADMNEFVLLKLEGQMVDYMVEASPETYGPFVEIINGKKVLYLQLLKALYGCVQSGLLWYELFAGTLMGLGFSINPVEPCVANKIIHGKVCTVLWYVDDVKISHVDPKVVTWLIKHLEAKFGTLTTTRGKKHTYLGMDIEFLPDGTVKIMMTDHLREAIEDFGENVTREVSSAAANDLNEPYHDSPLLDTKRQEIFHSVTMKLSYVAIRARPDLKTALSYLCKRVTTPNEKDWKKLKRLLCFVHQTIHDPLILGAESLNVLRTWVDASFAVHPDNMRSHTGGCMSYGTGIFQPMSTEQKMNVRSSTEAETVGASDYLPRNIWTQTFMAHQYIPTTDAPFGQDNSSAEKIEKNGWKSVGSRSRHINIKTFFVTDRHKSGDIRIEHCPTTEMVADYFTKPLQGSLFRAMRNVIMGYAPYTSLKRYKKEADVVESEERVGNMPELQTVTTSKIVCGKSYKDALLARQKIYTARTKTIVPTE